MFRQRAVCLQVWNNLPVSLASNHDWFLLACAAGTVLLLLLLIARVRLHPALALIAAALALGVASGMSLAQVPLSFAAGVGNLMGHIAIVLALGAVLGLGILVGMPVFFEVGLVLLLPIVAETARRGGKPPILVALPVLAGLSIVHAVLPPHPAAMLAATEFHADLGRTMLWGLAAGVPAAALAGPGLSWFLDRFWAKSFRVKGTSFSVESTGFRVKGTGFSPDISPAAQESTPEHLPVPV